MVLNSHSDSEMQIELLVLSVMSFTGKQRHPTKSNLDMLQLFNQGELPVSH
jgi:hypothetical protein